MPTASSKRLVFGSSVVTACLALLVFPANARADDAPSITVRELDAKTGAALTVPDWRVDYLSVGPMLSLVGGTHHATGIGFEGSWLAYPTGKMPSFGFGAFLQGQLYDGKYVRTAAGGEVAAGPAGLELGLAFRQGDDTLASTVAVHTALFLSVGYLFFAIRASSQLFALPTNEPSFGLETAITIGLKLPIAIYGQDPTGYAIQAAGR